MTQAASPARRHTVGILSDTHGWLHPAILEAFQGVDCIFHAGDIGSPEVLEALRSVAPLHVVRGNIDGGDLRFEPLTVTTSVAGRTFAMVHIAGRPERPTADAARLLSAEPDFFLCGHSHIPLLRRVGPTLWINPGACGRHGFHRERLALLLHLDPEGPPTMDRLHLGERTAPAGPLSRP